MIKMTDEREHSGAFNGLKYVYLCTVAGGSVR